MYTKGMWTPHQNKFGDWLVNSYDETPLSLKHSAVAEIPKNNDNAEANAHLIAAAPSMYEALKNLTAHYVSLVESGDAGNWDVFSEEVVKEAQKSITKAEGK